MIDPAIAERPAQVPAELVIDFDAYNPPNVEQDLQLAWKALQDSGVSVAAAVSWGVSTSCRCGGMWRL